MQIIVCYAGRTYYVLEGVSLNDERRMKYRMAALKQEEYHVSPQG